MNHRCCLFKKFPLVPYFGTPYTPLHRYCSHYKFIVFFFSIFAWFQSNQKYMLYHPIHLSTLFKNYLFFLHKWLIQVSITIITLLFITFFDTICLKPFLCGLELNAQMAIILKNCTIMLFPKVGWEDHVKSLILFQVMESFVSLVRCDFFFSNLRKGWTEFLLWQSILYKPGNK